MTQEETTLLRKIMSYLEQFEWSPESVEDSEGDITITLIAQLDIKEMKLQIKFSEDSHWIYFSALFVSSITNHQQDVYKKLLEINYSTTLTKFGLSPSGAVYALTELPAQTMDYEEFLSALRRLTNDVNTYLLPIANLIRSSETTD